jgi:hypothetical protein
MQHQLIAILIPVSAVLMPTAVSAQWRYPGYPGYPPYRYARSESSLRINVTPKEASVYVDGYFAGRVDEFDGRLQRLHVLPGEHEIVVYLDGYRSLKRDLYLSPDGTHTIEGSLEPLAPGEQQEAQPAPSERERAEPRDEERPPARAPFPRRGRREPPPPPAAPRDNPPPEAAPRANQGEVSRFATLIIQVRPGGGELRIDGEQRDAPDGDERLIVQVTEGRHRIEVERSGYEPFSTEVDARPGATTPITITLRRR